MIHIHFLPLYDVWNFSASDMSCLDQASPITLWSESHENCFTKMVLKCLK